MPNTDSNRVHHEISDAPNEYRKFDVEQVLNDIDEELSGKGYTQVLRDGSGVFISSIIIWASSSKIKKRVEVTFDRSFDPPFINQVVKDVYNEDGSAIIATTTTNITRTGDKKISNIDTETVRP